MKHVNCVMYKASKDGDPLADHDASGLLVPHTCSDASQFVKNTKAGIIVSLQHLLAVKPGMSKTAFESECSHWGWLDPLGNMLLDPVL